MRWNLLLTLLLLLLAGGLHAQLEFDLKAFSDTTKYGWNDYTERDLYRQDLAERQKLMQLYDLESNNIRTSIFKSMLLPGWGQLSSKANTKGSIILGTELMALGASLYFWDRSNYYHQKYEDATQVEQIEAYYNEALKPRQYSVIALGFAGVVWAYNLFDVIQTTDEYNARVWQDIIDKYGTGPVSLAPNGIQIRF